MCVCDSTHDGDVKYRCVGGGGEEEFIQLVIFKFANIGSSTAV